MKAHYDNQNNEQNKIKNNFTLILQRCNIKYNKTTKCPIHV